MYRRNRDGNRNEKEVIVVRQERGGALFRQAEGPKREPDLYGDISLPLCCREKREGKWSSDLGNRFQDPSPAYSDLLRPTPAKVDSKSELWLE